MLDIKLIRDNPDFVRQKLALRGENPECVNSILDLDKQRREYIGESEKLKSLRNSVYQEISQMKKSGADASGKIAYKKKVSDDIKSLDEKLDETEKQIHAVLRDIPNLPDDSVPAGKSPEV